MPLFLNIEVTFIDVAAGVSSVTAMMLSSPSCTVFKEKGSSLGLTLVENQRHATALQFH